MSTPAPPEPIAASYIGAKVIRATRLDGCGRPTYGQEKSTVVSDGTVSLEFEPEVAEGEDYEQRNSNGDLCVSEKGADVIKWWNTTIQFCSVDPDLVEIMNPSWKVELDAQGRAVGVRMTRNFSPTKGFGLELWSRSTNTGDLGCEPGDDPNAMPFGYTLLPWILGKAPDTITYENAAVTLTFKGRTKPGTRWGSGPYDVERDTTGAPVPLLTPMGADEDILMRQVTVPPPEAAAGAIALPAQTA